MTTALQILVVVALIGILAGPRLLAMGAAGSGHARATSRQPWLASRERFLAFISALWRASLLCRPRTISSQSWERWSPFGRGGTANG